MSRAALGRGGRAVCSVSMTKRPTSLRLSARSPITVSALVRQVLQRPGSGARGSSSTLSVSRSAGPARRIVVVEVVGAAGDAGAELVEDDPQPLAVGPAHDVVDAGRAGSSTRCARPGSSRRACSFCAARAGLAVDEVLADQRLRARTRRRRPRAASRSPSWSISKSTSALVRLRSSAQLGDLARAHAGDLDVGALDEPERVVELDRVRRAARRRRLRAGRA